VVGIADDRARAERRGRRREGVGTSRIADDWAFGRQWPLPDQASTTASDPSCCKAPDNGRIEEDGAAVATAAPRRAGSDLLVALVDRAG